MGLRFERVQMPADRDRLVDLLINDEWPFHGRRHIDAAVVDATEFSSSGADSYWIADDVTVGLVRVFDLEDIGLGAPRFDLRIISSQRGRGYGSRVTTWLVAHLFEKYADLHRIEAETRHDNVAMQRALTAAGFQQEGRLRSSWWSEDGTWFDTLVYGILRTDRGH